MTDDVILLKEHRCRDGRMIGQITLNNPKTLNALSLDMVKIMLPTIKKWEKRKDMACIIIDGSGDRAFCAGGDIQAVYYAMKEQPGQACELAESFFGGEYELDYAIHECKTPIIAWGNGVVMGGGLGIFMGCGIRVATETARVAMPEITIGLYPDVGGSYFLNQMPGKTGRFLGLTGAPINARDCQFLGLADFCITHKYKGELFELLQSQTWSDKAQDNADVVKELLSSLSDDSQEGMPEGQVEAHLDVINDLFSEADTNTLIDTFLAYSTDDKWLVNAQKTLQAGSPLSAHIIDEQLKRAVKYSLKEAFQSELILSTNIVRFTEFTEGIRALLIDKDRQPNWHYKTFNDVPKDFVASFFEAPWDTNPLAKL